MPNQPSSKLASREVELVFPTTRDNQPSAGSHGMSLRDYFAAQALGSLRPTATELSGDHSARAVTEHCYAIADAVLVLREKTE